MKEYAVHLVNASGDEYIVGHYRKIEDAQESLKRKKETRTLRKLYIVEREVTEWVKVKK